MKNRFIVLTYKKKKHEIPFPVIFIKTELKNMKTKIQIATL